MGHFEVITAVGVDSDVAGQWDSLFVNARFKIEVFDKRSDIDADLVGKFMNYLSDSMLPDPGTEK